MTHWAPMDRPTTTIWTYTDPAGDYRAVLTLVQEQRGESVLDQWAGPKVEKRWRLEWEDASCSVGGRIIIDPARSPDGLDSLGVLTGDPLGALLRGELRRL